MTGELGRRHRFEEFPILEIVLGRLGLRHDRVIVRHACSTSQPAGITSRSGGIVVVFGMIMSTDIAAILRRSAIAPDFRFDWLAVWCGVTVGCP